MASSPAAAVSQGTRARPSRVVSDQYADGRERLKRLSPGPVTVGFAVDDVDSVFAELAGRDVPVTELPRVLGVRNFYITDPHGYVIEFEQPKTAPT
jgi:hypothetical protein